MAAAGETYRAAAKASSETAPLLPGPSAPDGALAGGDGPAVQAGASDPAPESQKGNAYMAKLLPALAIGVRCGGAQSGRGPASVADRSMRPRCSSWLWTRP